MRAAIVTVGDEILRGIVLDTNSQWIAQHLSARGATVACMLTLADDPDEVAAALRSLLDHDLVVVSGGLGPTDDDLTLEAVAAALDVALEESAELLRWLEDFYDALAAGGHVPHGGVDEARRRMARLPAGAEALPNPVGAAPGVWLPPVLVLPGVPAEMKGIWEASVEPRLPAGAEPVAEVTGVIDSDDESALAPVARTVAAHHPDVYVKTRAQDFGGSGVVVTAFGAPERAAAALADLAREAGLTWRERPRRR